MRILQKNCFTWTLIAAATISMDHHVPTSDAFSPASFSGVPKLIVKNDGIHSKKGYPDFDGFNHHDTTRLFSFEATVAGEESMFPPSMLTKVDRLKRAATFWFKSAPILSHYYTNAGKFKVLEMHGMPMDTEEEEVSNEKGVLVIIDA